MQTQKSILEPPLVGILRGFNIERLPHILDAVARGGVCNIEITMNSPGAAAQIRRAAEFGNALHIGAGTVIHRDLLHEALEAGARFIVTPTLNRDIVRECMENDVPIFPGAFSPAEILEAWELGATMVKVFPAEIGGPAFIRGIRGPFPQIKLLPTGGVDLKTAAEYLRAGAAGLGVGSPLFDRARIEAGDWEWLEAQSRQFVSLFGK